MDCLGYLCPLCRDGRGDLHHLRLHCQHKELLQIREKAFRELNDHLETLPTIPYHKADHETRPAYTTCTTHRIRFPALAHAGLVLPRFSTLNGVREHNRNEGVNNAIWRGINPLNLTEHVKNTLPQDPSRYGKKQTKKRTMPDRWRRKIP